MSTKMRSEDALAKIAGLKVAGEGTTDAALAEESRGAKPGNGQKTVQPKVTTLRRPSHSKGDPAAVVTGYLDPLHVDVLVDLRSRLKVDDLSIPSTNQLLRIALRLLRTLKPSDAQVAAAFAEEKRTRTEAS